MHHAIKHTFKAHLHLFMHLIDAFIQSDLYFVSCTLRLGQSCTAEQLEVKWLPQGHNDGSQDLSPQFWGSRMLAKSLNHYTTTSLK